MKGEHKTEEQLMAELMELRQRVAELEAAGTERKRAEEETRRRTAQLEALRQVGLEITAELDLDSLLHSIVSRAIELVGGTSGGLYLYRPDQDVLEWSMAVGSNLALIGTVLHRGEGLSGKVWETGEPLIVDDYQQWDGRAAIYEGYPFRATMSVSIRWSGELLGVLNVLADPPRTFSPADAELLSLFATQTAIAIENARLYEQAQQEIAERKQAEEALERRAAQLATVGEIGRQIASILDLDELLHQIANLLEDAFGYRYVYILLLDEDSNELVARAGAGAGRVLEGTRIPTGSTSINTYVARTGDPLLANDVSKEPTYLLLEEIADTRSELCVPIRLTNQVMGTLDVQSAEFNAFDESDLITLQTLADQAAIAIETARLFAEAERRAKDLALLLDTSTAISSTLDLDHILETVAQQIITSLVATFCRITLLDEAGENLVIRTVASIRAREAEDGFGRRCPLALVPWHRKVIETGQTVILRQDVPELGLSDEERKMALTESVQSAALVPLIVGGRVLGVISMGEERSWERSPFTPEKVELCQSIARQAAVAIENARLYGETQRSFERLQRTFEGIINALVSAIEMRDRYTAGHQRRVTQLACAIANEMGLPKERIEGLRMAGLIHDLGKINIPVEILSKPGRLNEIEYGLIKAHPQVGYDVLKTIDFPWPVAKIVLQHHERLEGSGYPQGLLGERILLEARILAVADVVEAMASFRPYRPALGIDKALEEISQNRGVLYDPEVADVCLKLFAEKGFEFE